MDRQKAIDFCHKYSSKKFYQPVVFVPGVIEILGKWDTGTKELADIALGNCAGKSVLDLGCMHGFFLHEAIRQGAKQAVGVDYDVAEIAIAQEIRNILEMPIELVHENIHKYQPNQSFDIILMMNITHVLDDPQKTIAKFMNIANNSLIVEYRSGQNFFPRKPNQEYDSPRSVGYRKLAFFDLS